MSLTGNQGSAAKAAKGGVSELESMLSQSPSSDRVCLKLARILRVRGSEVALLRLEKGSLRFVFPPELRSAGVLPLTGSAVSAPAGPPPPPLLLDFFLFSKHNNVFLNESTGGLNGSR